MASASKPLPKQTLADSATIKDIVKLDTFKGKFAPKDFLELLSAKLVAQAQSTPRQFDPKPFIRNFEASIDELLRLKRKVHNKIDDLEDQAAASEKARRKKLVEINESMQDAQAAFESLESRLGEVGKTAIRIGEQLETIDKQRTRAAEAKDLIQYFIEFNTGNSHRLDELRDEDNEGEFKAAIVLRRLTAIAKEVDIAGAEAARTNIENYSEGFEKELLARFDEAYRAGNRRTMNECAKTLVEFNGGESCVRVYVNQHEFFINQSKIEDLEPVAEGERREDDSKQPDPALVRLCDEIRETCKQEWDAIRAVFPNAPIVMQQFIQRIFAQSIQAHLESILRRSDEESLQSYLRALSASHATIASLVNDLHKLDQDLVADKVGKPVLTAIINRSFDDLFVPYIEGGKYIEAEKDCIADAFNGLLSIFYEYAAQRAKTPRGKAVTKPVQPTGPPSPTKVSPTSAEAMMTKIVSNLNVLGQEVAQQIGLQPAPEPLSPEEMGLPSVQLMLRVLELHVEAMARCRELTQPSEVAKNGSMLFKLLIETVGVRYVEVALDMMIEDLQFADPRQQPDVKQLPMVESAQNILQLLQLHFQMCIVPIISSSPTVHREMVMYKNSFMSAVEHRLNTLIQKQIDAIVGWLTVVLNNQKKTDFRPKDENGGGMAATPTCVQASDFLTAMYEQASNSLRGENLDIFLTEIGVAFHSLLLDHIKKFVVNQAGGLTLLKDIARYQQTIALFKIPIVNERFEMLKEIVNLFVVKPEHLRTVMKEGHLSRIDLPLLHPFLSMRADWSKLGKFEKDFAVQNVQGRDSRSSTALK